MVIEKGTSGVPHAVHPVRVPAGRWWWPRRATVGYLVAELEPGTSRIRRVLCDRRTGEPWVFNHQAVARMVARNLAGDPLAQDEARARAVHP